MRFWPGEGVVGHRDHSLAAGQTAVEPLSLGRARLMSRHRTVSSQAIARPAGSSRDSDCMPSETCNGPTNASTLQLSPRNWVQGVCTQSMMSRRHAISPQWP